MTLPPRPSQNNAPVNAADFPRCYSPMPTRRMLIRSGLMAGFGASLAGCRGLKRSSGDAVSASVRPPVLWPAEGAGSEDAASQPNRENDAVRPDLSDAAVIGFKAGIRPFRRGGFRLEVEPRDDQMVIHNYGHGGAGWTLAWGCAERVATMVTEAGARRGDRVAVIGAGIIGLSSAMALVERGIRVTIYAERFGAETTSHVAGGQFAPSLVDDGDIDLEPLIREGARRYGLQSERGMAVRHVTNLAQPRRSRSLDRLPEDLSHPEEVERLPIAGPPRRGWQYQTFLAEPPAYLPQLSRQLLERGVVMMTRRFESPAAWAGLNARWIVNATGLGARDLMEDSRVIPVRGQLVHLRPQPLPWLLSSEAGYLFPRADALVCGGTYERNEEVAVPDAGTCRSILQRHRDFFGPVPNA